MSSVFQKISKQSARNKNLALFAVKQMTETIGYIDHKLFEILETVSDPEIPVLSIMEMGVVVAAKLINGFEEVKCTQTYSGSQQWM